MMIPKIEPHLNVWEVIRFKLLWEISLQPKPICTKYTFLIFMSMTILFEGSIVLILKPRKKRQRSISSDAMILGKDWLSSQDYFTFSWF